MMIPTPKFRPAASVLFVGVDDGVKERVAAAILPVQALSAGHASAATERMLATQPLVVVAGGALREDEIAAIGERASAIGAEVVSVASYPVVAELITLVVAAIATAEHRRAATPE